MRNAFTLLFDKRYKQVAIIGSDCYELSRNIILSALSGLQNNDVVIGPAKDGGYYLLGMNRLIPKIFESKRWGTGSVFQETITDIRHLNYSIAELPVLNDVDEAGDVNFTY